MSTIFFSTSSSFVGDCDVVSVRCVVCFGDCDDCGDYDVLRFGGCYDGYDGRCVVCFGDCGDFVFCHHQSMRLHQLHYNSFLAVALAL